LPCFEQELKNKILIGYRGEGKHIAQDFYIPVLKRTTFYDRISGYFSVESLVITAAGLAGLIKNEGKMRLVLGAHDVGEDIELAYQWSREKNNRNLEEISQKISENLDNIEDIFSKRRLEAMAWMLKNGTLEIKVAMPKRTLLGLGNGIFHEKTLIFKDGDRCIVEAAGSANETKMAYDQNGENLTIHMSWRPGAEEYILREIDNFEVLWNDNHPDYNVYDLPQAISHKLKQKYYPQRPPELDPEEDPSITKSIDIELINNLFPLAKLVKQLGFIRHLSHLGFGPVMLFPHQAHAVSNTLNHFPHRILLADEVGLGKTLEAGAIIKRLINSGVTKRILILTPKNVTRQWLEELQTHFALKFWMLENNPKRLVSSDKGELILKSNENPFDRPGVDMIIASWHYARGTRTRQSELLMADRFFDLVVIDEAHAARKKRELDGTITPTRLNELCGALSISSPHILMLTATPVQLYEAEALDLLSILGLGGPWVHEDDFKEFYNIISREPSGVELDKWLFAFRLASWIANNYMLEQEIKEVLEQTLDKEIANEIFYAMKTQTNIGNTIEEIMRRDPESLRRLLIAFSPMRVFMIRNTRSSLEKAGYVFPVRDVKEEPIELQAAEAKLLRRLDDYLASHYGRYEQVISKVHRVNLGFVRSIYHQRFVSSFTAAYLSIRNRKLFLESLLRHDDEAIKKLAEKMFEDEDFEEDEEEIIETMMEMVEVARPVVIQEIEVLASLESDLSQYSPDIQTSNDPKLKRIVKLVSEFISEGKKVIIFSKYTDTVEAVKRILLKSGNITKMQLGTYTGSGGMLYDEKTHDFKSVAKDEVAKALAGNAVQVLVCSDAASEGLNLQAANVIINVDMPWNPAKVEQRIGRADRLGQKSNIVNVRNVWYPDSIEARIYRELFRRKELYHVVVGPGQEIISHALRNALDENARGAQLTRIIEDVLEQVERAKDNIQRTLHLNQGTTWQGKKKDEDLEFIQRILKFVKLACEALGYTIEISKEESRIKITSKNFPELLQKWNNASIEPGLPNTLTPAHPIVIYLADEIERRASDGKIKFSKSCYIVKEHDGLGELIVIDENLQAPTIADRQYVIKILDELLEAI